MVWKDLTVLRDLLCDIQSVCEPDNFRVATTVTSATVMYPFSTAGIIRELTAEMLQNQTNARLAIENEAKAANEEAESFVNNIKSGMFR